MFKNTFKTAFRSLIKNKSFTFLNVLGLSLGLASCLLIVLYVVNELSYDRFNIKADRIFRVNTDTKFGLVTSSRAICSSAVANAFMREFPEVENAVRLLPDQELIKKDNEYLAEDKMAYADPGIFDVFTLPMIEGDPKSALTDPHSVVITASAAKKYFGNQLAPGKTLRFFGDSTIHKITGVIRDIPAASYFHFDFFLTMGDVKESRNDRLNVIQPYSTFVLVKGGTDYKKLENKFPDLLRKNLDFYDALVANGDFFRLNLTPLTAIHLHSNKTDELGRNGNSQYVNIFSASAVFILLIACINFMNLSTARFSQRAREVGVRKILGSTRKALAAQFLVESTLVTGMAGLIASIAAWAILPFFNQLSGKHLLLDTGTLAWLLPSLIGLILGVGLLSGSYPAFFLSAFRSIDVLKGKTTAVFKKAGFRSVLVVFQFTISICLIIGTLVIYNQLKFIQGKGLGFNRNQVIVVKNINDLTSQQAKILKQEVKQLSGVLSASLSSFLPTNNMRWINYFRTPTSNLQAQFWFVDEDYLSSMGMKLESGRDFSRELVTDSSAIIINETAAKILGLAKNALNQKLYFASNDKESRIIGIVKDFNFSSLRENITPVVLGTLPRGLDKDAEQANDLSIRVSNGQWGGLLNQIEKKWKALSAPEHFSYSFMDDDFEAIYSDEQRMGKIVVLFTTLAILIASLGLFGLSAYAAEQRTKEIAIRKVLGAGVQMIYTMLTKDFIRLVLLAMIIAFPISWFLMQKWLQDFAYRVGIPWWLLGIAGLAALLFAFIPISYQSIKAANSNPVQSLRSQ